MENKPHLKLNNEKINTDVKWTYKSRYVPPLEQDYKEAKHYSRMAVRFRNNIDTFKSEIKNRNLLRTIPVSIHIDHIVIRFYDSFNLRDFGKSYLITYGLDVVRLYEFNKCVLFAISNKELFKIFLNQIEIFIKWTEGEAELKFDKKILFIESFNLLTSQQILCYNELKSIVRFSLADSLYNFNQYQSIKTEFIDYLKLNKIDHFHNAQDLIIETQNIPHERVIDIINNFDVVFSVTSSLSTVIGPSKFKIPERSYGFTVSNSDAKLPLVGIIDTGVDVTTPLFPIMEKGYDYTGTNAFEDIVDHGTSVAALAALGTRPYKVGFRGEIETDARIISIKVMNDDLFPLKDNTVLNAITRVKSDYNSIKIFVLTITYDQYKNYNEPHSDYAYQLDKISHELGILIFISVGNLKPYNDLSIYDLTYYDLEKTNLQSPSESMNNISVGSYADNKEDGSFLGIAPIKEFPALFTRSAHYRLSDYFTVRKINKNLLKPDFIMPGGDFEFSSDSSYFAQGDKASMLILSSDPKFSFNRQVGTSYSAPLAANLALKLLKLYPDLKAQTIKALLINGSENDIFDTRDDLLQIQLKKVVGQGIPNEERILYSNDNRITFIIERTIKHKEFLVIPIKIPNYLNSLSKDKGLLRFTLTLCFSFLPDKDNQLAYCPVFIAYSVFRNATPKTILEKYAQEAKLRKSFSQDGYSISKPSLYSNVQKMSFTVSKTDLISEDGTFMLAIHSFISPHIKAGTPELRKRIGTPVSFSIAMAIEEIQSKTKISNKLYNEMLTINQVESILDSEIEIELEP